MKKFIQDITFVAFDVETTGLTPSVDRIVEIGAVKFQKGKIIDTSEELIYPEMSIPPIATNINGITDDMVRRRPTIEKILPRFLSFLEDAVPVAHNSSFDVGFLAYDLLRLKFSTEDQPILDTLSISKFIFPGYNSYSLINLSNSFNIKSNKFNRALSDSNICMAILLKCLREIGDFSDITLQDVLAVNGPSLKLDIKKISHNIKFQRLISTLKPGGKFEIVYRDTNGCLTTRKMVPLFFSIFQKTVILEAFCYLRKDKRHFRLDRIIKVK